MTMIDKKDRLNKRILIDAIIEAGGKCYPNSVLCPFHNDKKPSGSIYQDKKTGAYKYKCHCSDCGFHGDVFDVRAKNGKGSFKPATKPGLKPPKRIEPPKKKKTFNTIQEICNAVNGEFRAAYQYLDPETKNVDILVIRYIDKDTGKKSFAQARQKGDEFVFGAPPKPWPLYHRVGISRSDTVVVVEGEKCVESLRGNGHIATTSVGGGEKDHAKNTDWEPLAGKKIILWPDNDDTGRKHMKDVANILHRLNPEPELYWIDSEKLGLPVKGDAADLDDEPNRVREIIAGAIQFGASNDLKGIIDLTISGERSAIKFPWDFISMYSKALLPGTITLMCGEPGSSKSFWLLECIYYWNKISVPVSVFELEEDRGYHLHRMLAQISGRSDILSDEWIRVNPELSQMEYVGHRGVLDDIGKHIWDSNGLTDVRIDDLTDWVRDRAKDGFRIIAIDPISVASKGKDSWTDDLRFVNHCKTICNNYKTSLLLITHPKMGNKPDMDNLAGGKAYSRLSQTIFFLRNTDSEAELRTPQGTIKEKINRTIKIAKARNGYGNATIGYQFRGLKFSERGILSV